MIPRCGGSPVLFPGFPGSLKPGYTSSAASHKSAIASTTGLDRSFLQSKAFVRSERTGCQSNLKKKRGKGKRDKRESMHRNSSVQLSFSDVSFSALSSWTQDASSGNSQGRREDGSAMTRDCRVEHQETAHLAPPLRTCPTAPISQCIGEIINNNKNKHARVLTMH